MGSVFTPGQSEQAEQRRHETTRSPDFALTITHSLNLPHASVLARLGLAVLLLLGI